MSKLTEYVQQLSSEGRVHGSNENFVIHLAKAREKMAIFQEQEPAYCFLRWYQAAVVGGAEEVFFEMESGCHTMIIPFPEEPDLGPLCRAFDGDQAELSRRDRLLLDGLLSSTSAEMETSISTARECHILSAGELEKPGWWSRLVAGTRGAYKKNSLQIRVRVSTKKQSESKTIATIRRRTRFGPIVPHFALDLKRRPSVVYDEVPMFDKWMGLNTETQSYSKADFLLESWKFGPACDGWVCRQRTLRESKARSRRQPDSMLAQCETYGGAAIAVSLALSDEQTLIPVQHGVTLAPLRRDIGCPGATLVFACDSLQTDLSGFHLRESNDLDKKVEELKASVRSILNDTRDDFLRLKPRPLWPIQPKGLCLGVLIGALAFFKWGVAGQLLMACLFGSLGMAVERFVRRREIKKAERIRTHEFRAKVLERLGLAEGESAV